MDLNTAKPIKRFEIFLLIYISLQPIIDVLTTLGIVKFHQNATIGVFFRLFIMLFCLVYILVSRTGKIRNIVMIYLLLLFAAFAINLVISHSHKPVFHLMDEVKYLAKIGYAQVMLLTYILLFTSLAKRMNVIDSLKKYIVYAAVIVDVVMIVSILTSTSLNSYSYTKIGYTGWFYAGNEIGAILAIIFPITIFNALSNTAAPKLIYNWIPVVLTAFSLLMFGTKVGYGAALLSLGITLVVCLIYGFFIRKEKGMKSLRFNGIVTFVLLVVLVISTPFTPVFKNTYAHFQLLGINLNSNSSANTGNTAAKKPNQKSTLSNMKKGQVENLILSSREIYLQDQQNQFKKAPAAQKLFGMGYAGNYKSTAKMIEMDFYDLFYSLGIIGFIIFIFPYAFMLIHIGYNLIKHIRTYLTPLNVLFLTALLLGLGIAYSAGHVLTAPAVSIYFSIILAFLFINRKTDQS